jgi:chitin disaccharide deacetylase
MSAAGRGLLIVNADDWGYDEETTEAISICHRAGGLTSTTAMTFMRGSKAAAERSAEHPDLGIGLHLNLVEEYSDPDTPAEVRARQRDLIEHSRLLRLRRWVYDPWVRHAVNRVIADQLQCFIDLYGRLPTHLDGHHHCHLEANVLLSPAVPPGTKIRNALSPLGRPNPLLWALRRGRERLILRHFTTTEYFFSVATAWPDLTGAPPLHQLGLARGAAVEIMVHPAFPHELGPLQSDAWLSALSELPTGDYRDLQP